MPRTRSTPQRILAILCLAVIGLAGGLVATNTVTVRSGDTLSRLATQHGTTVRSIVEANGLTNPDRIRIGQTLVISSGATTTTVASSTPSAASVSVTAPPPAAPTPAAQLPPAPASVVPKDTDPAGANYGTLTVTTYYLVQPGDSFSTIGRRFALDARRLASANGLYGTETLVPGQLLRIA